MIKATKKRAFRYFVQPMVDGGMEKINHYYFEVGIDYEHMVDKHCGFNFGSFNGLLLLSS